MLKIRENLGEGVCVVEGTRRDGAEAGGCHDFESLVGGHQVDRERWLEELSSERGDYCCMRRHIFASKSFCYVFGGWLDGM